MPKDTYKVIVWGPGILGSGIIREVLKKPELELVGVLCYSPEKDGKDVGDVLGLPPTGVKMTADREAIFNMDADVVLHTPKVTATGVTEDIERLLESGKNVISSFFFPPVHNEVFSNQIKKAGEKHGTSVFPTGISPGLLLERFMTGFTAVCTHVNSIAVKEVYDLGCLNRDMLIPCGFGQTPEQSAAQDTEFWMAVFGYSINTSLHSMGIKPDKIDLDVTHYLTEKEYQLPELKIDKGTIGAIKRTFTAIVDGKPFLTLDEIWHIDEALSPVEATSEDYYEIKIDGEPCCIDVRFDIVNKLESKKRFKDGDNTIPSYYATWAPMVQAIPMVINADPGIIFPKVLTNYMKDMRDYTQ